MEKVCSRSFFVRFFTGLGRTSKEPQVAELITSCDGFIVYHSRACRPTRNSVIHERNKSVLLELVNDHENTFLDIAHNDTASLSLQSNNQIWHNLGLGFAKKLAHTEVINAQIFSN